MDCGPACLRMIAKYYGKNYSLQTLREYSFLSREGVSLMGLSDAAESIGLRTVGLRITLEQLKKDVPLPCILYWNQYHFVVCYGIKKQRGRCLFQIADPASSLLVYSEAEIKRYWLSAESDSRELGIVLALEPGARFFEKDDEPAIVAALAEKIVAFFNRSDLDHVHQVSYDIAKGFLTEEIEQKWLNLVKEMTSHD